MLASVGVSAFLSILRQTFFLAGLQRFDLSGMAQVRLTEALKTQLLAENLNPNVLTQRFSEWKSGDEYSSYLFGKDGLGLKTTVLRHVHLVPIHDLVALSKWNIAWGRKPPGRKTSDRYLFYCDGGANSGYLLIYIVGDPGGHKALFDSKPLIDKFEACADQFVNFGTISL